MGIPEVNPLAAPHDPSPAPGGAGRPGRVIVLSWLISAAWHAGLFAVMFTTAWLSNQAEQQDDLPIARTELLGELTEARVQVDFETRPPLRTEVAKPDVLPVQPKRFDVQTQTLSADRPELFIAGIGTGSGGDAARPDLSIVGIGTGGGDDFSKYGLRASAGGPGPEFFGLGRRARGARNIVYVVDRSGSMMTTFDAVRGEMRRSVDGLRRGQKFHVILFNAGPPLENRPKKLVPATASQKGHLFEFLDAIQAEGATDPIPAMERAFEVDPDLIYFLTDGDFAPALLERLRELNRDQRVKIFTIAYVSEAGRGLLEQIAREHGGEFRFVSDNELF